jgi:hypothetical protein
LKISLSLLYEATDYELQGPGGNISKKMIMALKVTDCEIIVCPPTSTLIQESYIVKRTEHDVKGQHPDLTLTSSPGAQNGTCLAQTNSSWLVYVRVAYLVD